MSVQYISYQLYTEDKRLALFMMYMFQTEEFYLEIAGKKCRFRPRNFNYEFLGGFPILNTSNFVIHAEIELQTWFPVCTRYDDKKKVFRIPMAWDKNWSFEKVINLIYIPNV